MILIAIKGWSRSIPDHEVRELQQRNDRRFQLAAQSMGRKHTLHSSHSPEKTPYVPVLKRDGIKPLV